MLAPIRFLVAFKAKLVPPTGGGKMANQSSVMEEDGGAQRLVNFLITLEQVTFYFCYFLFVWLVCCLFFGVGDMKNVTSGDGGPNLKTVCRSVRRYDLTCHR